MSKASVKIDQRVAELERQVAELRQQLLRFRNPSRESAGLYPQVRFAEVTARPTATTRTLKFVDVRHGGSMENRSAAGNTAAELMQGEDLAMVVEHHRKYYVIRESGNAVWIKASLHAALASTAATVAGTVVEVYHGTTPDATAGGITLRNLEAPGGNYVFEGSVGTKCWAYHLTGKDYAIVQMGCD